MHSIWFNENDEIELEEILIPFFFYFFFLFGLIMFFESFTNLVSIIKNLAFLLFKIKLLPYFIYLSTITFFKKPR